MNRPALYSICVAWFLVPAWSAAQTGQRAVSPQEYIQSVSPLASGGSVVSRSTPGSNVQTVTTIAQLPSRSSANPSVGFESRSYPGQWSVNAGQGISPGAVPGGANNSYAYPVDSNSRFSQRPTNTLGLEPLGSRAFRNTQFSQPTPNYQLAQNCATCPGGTSTNYPIPNFSPLPGQSGTTINPPATLGAPTLIAPQPVFAPDASSPGMQYNPNLGFDTSAPGVFNSGRTNYTPLFALRNLPPGTYIGQGLLGQPKAYIDGEPIRNLLRYMSY